MARKESSIVEYFAEHERYRCGYCGCSDTNYSHGMWAHSLTVQDYQDLIDKGWRRSGKYCYKPTMSVTCCPQYAIRCEALNFKLSKSQKKILRRVNRFLITGQKATVAEDFDNTTTEGPGGDNFLPGKKSALSLTSSDVKNMRTEVGLNTPSAGSLIQRKVKIGPISQGGIEESVLKDGGRKVPAQGEGADNSKPACRKARQQRLERKMQKTGLPLEEIKAKNQSKNNTAKSLEEFLNEPLRAENPAHQLEVKLVRTSPPTTESRLSFNQSHQLFKTYQMTVHQEEEYECTKDAFRQFLVDSPLEPVIPELGECNLPQGYGSFHQHYLLDGKLIAVGVIDILPNCVSSVYLYYDPDYSFLTLGTYSALRELAFVRELQKIDPAMIYYYMGFYIHSCPKMRYKGQYHPSYLLCPETYSWVPISCCIPKLDARPYARLEEQGKVDSEGRVDIDRVLVLYDREAMSYEVYRYLKQEADDEEEVSEYATLVGMTCAQRMLLFRK